jgi:hypothetical protein
MDEKNFLINFLGYGSTVVNEEGCPSSLEGSIGLMI